jgi:hypothetical protein
MEYYDKLLDGTDEEEIKKLLFGRKVTVKENGCNGILLLDNGIELEIVPNTGCGGCSSGNYELTVLNGCDNAITNVELATDDYEDEEDGYYETDTSYKIFVFTEDKRITLAQVDGTDGNGYYGTGYEIYVRFPKEVE